jgi:hypothetical protein
MACRHLPASGKPYRTVRKALRARGVVVLEFILAMPIVFFATLGIFEFVILGLLIHGGTTAAIEAAREGARVYPPTLPFLDPNGEPSFDPDDYDDIADRIALTAEKYIGLYGLDVETTPVAGRSTAVVQIKRNPLSSPLETATRGNNGLTFSQTGTDPADGEIIVTVAFRYVDPGSPSGNGNPLPDWLSVFGFSLQDARFQLTARASLE